MELINRLIEAKKARIQYLKQMILTEEEELAALLAEAGAHVTITRADVEPHNTELFPEKASPKRPRAYKTIHTHKVSPWRELKGIMDDIKRYGHKGDCSKVSVKTLKSDLARGGCKFRQGIKHRGPETDHEGYLYLNSIYQFLDPSKNYSTSNQ